MGLGDTQHIARILVHPTNPDIVYVASPGHEYTFNPERGIYKTTNGGKTWQKIFYKDEKTGVIDLAMDPENPEILYAGTAERLRLRWNDPKESPQTGLYKTVDGGKTWTSLTNGLPDFSKGDSERIGISISRSKPNVVYALIDRIINTQDGAYLYRSEDKGATWKLVEGNDRIKAIYPGYGWVFGQVRVDPNNADIVYVMGLNYLRSKDGGKTWENLKGSHSDYHVMWINPKDSRVVAIGHSFGERNLRATDLFGGAGTRLGGQPGGQPVQQSRAAGCPVPLRRLARGQDHEPARLPMTSFRGARCSVQWRASGLPRSMLKRATRIMSDLAAAPEPAHCFHSGWSIINPCSACG
ncbi:MAG: hypothetical protein LAQ30_28625 [Acidobacteriia bacterium]|nr:hypothetical protein [Terriglobia bacterium]